MTRNIVIPVNLPHLIAIGNCFDIELNHPAYIYMSKEYPRHEQNSRNGTRSLKHKESARYDPDAAGNYVQSTSERCAAVESKMTLLQNQLLQLDGKVDRITEMVSERDTIASLEAERDELQKVNHRLLGELKTKSQSLMELEYQITYEKKALHDFQHAIYASWSWKVTAPLRYVLDTLIQLNHLFRKPWLYHRGDSEAHHRRKMEADSEFIAQIDSTHPQRRPYLSIEERQTYHDLLNAMDRKEG